MKTLTVPEQHQCKVALDTLKLSEVGASVLGGMNHRQAIQFLRSIGYRDDDLACRLWIYGHDNEAAEKYMAP